MSEIGMLEEQFETFIMLDKQSVPDGMGGSTKAWVESMRFEAALDKDDDLNARIAEKQGVTSVYTIITRKNVVLDFHDVVRRVSDGLTYRITGNTADNKTPDSAGLPYAWTTVERWDLPK